MSPEILPAKSNTESFRPQGESDVVRLCAVCSHVCDDVPAHETDCNDQPIIPGYHLSELLLTTFPQTDITEINTDDDGRLPGAHEATLSQQVKGSLKSPGNLTFASFL